jgi:hypothetical protein
VGTHPLRRTSDIRPIYSGAKSRPKPTGPQYITKEDARILAGLFGFRDADELIAFAEYQGIKAIERSL